MFKRKQHYEIIREPKEPKIYDWTVVTPLKSNSVLQSSVFSMGCNFTGELGLEESVYEVSRPRKMEDLDCPVVQISCGGMHTVALLADSSIVTFGCNDDGELGRPVKYYDRVPTRVETGFKAVQIAAGENFTAVLSENGEVYACGTFRSIDGNFGLVAGGEVTETSLRRLPLMVPVKKISAGYNHLAVLTVEGEIFTIGSPEFGQLGRISSYFSRRFDDWKSSYLTLLPVRDIKMVDITDIWCGNRNTFFRLRYCYNYCNIFGCGINDYGQLGVNNCNHQYFPMGVLIFDTIIHIAMGDNHTLFLTSSGVLNSCGSNLHGQLGVKYKVTSSSRPMWINCGFKFAQCACGPVSSFGLSTDGVLYSWGASSSILGQGKISDKLFIDQPTPIALVINSGFKLTHISAGRMHACLLYTQSIDGSDDKCMDTTKVDM